MLLPLKRFLGLPTKSKKDEFTPPTEQELVRREAEVGSRIFGIVPPGRRRQFFNLDSHTWIWYEEWTDNYGQRQAVTTRYEVRGDIILKIQGDHQPEKLEGEELRNLYEATRSYYYQIAKQVYHRPISS